jgi:2-phospho-L-lactate transferase/gluconeogenesis factor (CofD/UPF0052 family)
MNIVIFSGGSGSEQLQKGLHQLYGSSIHTYIIVNGYDDGKSTGIVRNIYNNMILGPSDLRKNHLILHKLHVGESALYQLLHHRFTSSAPYEYVVHYIEMFRNQLTEETYHLFLTHVHLFFNREETKQYVFEDFNLGNIIYASLFFEKGIESALSLLSRILMIPNCVLFHNHEPLRLKAITQHNRILEHECDIVDFNSEEDVITGIYLEDNANQRMIPELELSVLACIQQADMILFSCGTQWSSLFPTYHSKNFYDIIQRALAKKYLFINNNEDGDMKHVPIEDYFRLYRSFLPVEQITFIFSREGHFTIPSPCPYPCIILDNAIENGIHKPIETIIQLFKYHLREYLQYTHYVFDYDYTLYDSTQPELSDRIMKELYRLNRNKSIVSNNDKSNLRIEHTSSFQNILCNLGSYDYKNNLHACCYQLSKEDKEHIYRMIVPYQHLYQLVVTDRLYSICIKPVSHRDTFCRNLNRMLLPYHLRCIKTGTTSLEISKIITHKDNGLRTIFEKHKHDNLLYVSDIDDVTLDVHKYIIPSLSSVHILLITLTHLSPFLPDLIVIAGGKNTRNNHIPKGTCILDTNQSVLDTIYDKSKRFIRNMYVITIDEYKNDYHSDKYHTISCGASTNGNQDTFERGMKQLSTSSYTITCWSDAVVYDSIIFAELSVSYDDFRIPCRVEKHPYAYLCIQNDNVYDVRFQKTHPIEYGLHDLSVFQLCPIHLLRTTNNESSVEKNLFDYIRTHHSTLRVGYYLSSSRIESFNTVEEFNTILSS